MAKIRIVRQLKPVRVYEFYAGIIKRGRKVDDFWFPSRNEIPEPKSEKQLLKEHIRKYGQPLEVAYAFPDIALFEKDGDLYKIAVSSSDLNDIRTDLMRKHFRIETHGSSNSPRTHYSETWGIIGIRDNHLYAEPVWNYSTRGCNISVQDLQEVVAKLTFRKFGRLATPIKAGVQFLMACQNYDLTAHEGEIKCSFAIWNRD